MAEDSYFKKIQKQMRVSQSEMADMMGVARGTLVNLENGKTEVVTGSVLKFCRATGISLLEVMEALFPEYCGDLLKEETQHKEILRQTVNEYEDRLTAKDEEIRRQKELVQALQQTVEAQKQMIGMLERQSAKND
ncbi:MAG: helix-turn-helix domain-containing protein [Bacteroidales bacterium]|nr:helix-turn-helix domain-containing protein [Bacteroidales bacterium]